MKISKILQILVFSVMLSGYSTWIASTREAKEPGPSLGKSGATIRLLRLSEAEALWHAKSTIFLDVRSAADYEAGHIRGAWHFPEEEFEQRFPDLRPRLERAKAIVVYCKSRDCGKSLWTTIRLRNHGLTQTRIYPNGWNEWYLRGLPTSRRGR